MTVGKPFSMDKPGTSPGEMTKLQAFNDFCLFIALSTAYIVQVSVMSDLISRGSKVLSCSSRTVESSSYDDIKIFVDLHF